MATSSSSFDAGTASPLHPPDVTQAPHGETATKNGASLALTQHIFERAAVGMLVLDLTSHGIHAMNPAFRALWASLHVAAEGDGDGEERLLDWLGERGILAQAEVAATEGKTYTGLQIELAGDDGEGEHACWTYDLVPLSVPDAQANDVGSVLLTVVDVSDLWRGRRRAEQATFEAQVYAEKLEAAIEQLAEGLILHDQIGQIRAYNRAALDYATNRSAVEAARSRGVRLEPDWRLFWLDGTPIPEMERPSSRAMMTGGPISGAQMLVLGEDGAYTPIIVNAAPIRTEEGLIAGSVTAFQDISAVKEVERLKDEFISIASHELRQPLTVIQGQAQLLRRNLNALVTQSGAGAHNLESLRRYVDGIESQTGRLNALVSDLLDMSRIQTGQLRLEPRRVALLDSLRHVVEQQRDISQGHELRLTLHLPPRQRELEGQWDPRRIEQILMNLLSNAIKYSPAGGRVDVEVSVLPNGHVSEQVTASGRRRVSGPAAHILIRDEGIGIPPDALPRLFERFYRAHNTAGIQGTGLGLYICRQLAWAHGGDLWVESAGIGQGTTFHLVLPLLKGRATPAHRSDAR